MVMAASFDIESCTMSKAHSRLLGVIQGARWFVKWILLFSLII
jgi:hypothetical protein